MGFARVDTWSEPPALRWSLRVSDSAPIASATVTGVYVERQLLRVAAWAGTAVIHCVLIWFLLSRLGADVAIDGGTRNDSAIAVFGLAPSSPADAAPSRVVPPPVPSQPLESEVDTGIETGLPPPEWTVSRIRAPRPTEVPAPSSPAVLASAASGVSAGVPAGAGGEVYDPYAGASPMRQKPPATVQTVQTVQTAQGDGIVDRLFKLFDTNRSANGLDRQVTRRVVALVKRANPNARGTVEVEIRTSPDGVITDAKPVGGDAAASVKHALCAALIGQRLANGVSSTSYIRLSPFNIA